ncbi:hypothetical protein RN001_007355 [Aquatica leii]|uniref:Xaa-Pro aminopeptidase 1 n=1 Tax=Aquatica leii TaxID=1421715 RepID=A0AAN7SGS6_9COLE|nr:hypothetical protein RN001_007355 [Aquatica leii]
MLNTAVINMDTPRTADLLLKLRNLMKGCKYYPEPIHAYLVPTTDSHNSEYPAECDQRREFISKFTGSRGDVVITDTHACLWTDARYFLQASHEMDSNWTLMKEGLPSTPSQKSWLVQNLPPCSNVGVDAKVISYSVWKDFQSELQLYGHKLVSVDANLIDIIWVDRPLPSKNPIAPLELKYSGKTIGDKMKDVRIHMENMHATILVLSALDEIAWLLNLRGSDIICNPVFFSYVVIAPNSVTVLLNLSKVTSEIKDHFKKEAEDLNLEIAPYENIIDVMTKTFENFTDGFVWLSKDVNCLLASVVPSHRLKTSVTPPAFMKLVKNDVEIQGMKNAHIKDGVAICCYYAWLENAIKTKTVTELSGAKKLEEFRKQQIDFVYPSFETISGFGHHGSIIHYRANKTTDVPITSDALYLCDSGGQYKDGTTDVTRTFHFGTPTEFEKDCYTRVLKGQLKVARMVFPSKIKGNCIDSFARQFLWEVGLDYGHGTGHGVGAYMNVHEPPIGMSYRPFPDDPGLEPGMFLSNEPGYYEEGKFGIRIEDVVLVVPYKPINTSSNCQYLTFETVTWAPKMTKLIKTDMLTKQEIAQLNAYHQKCRDILGPAMEQQNQQEAKEWLWKETEPIASIN